MPAYPILRHTYDPAAQVLVIRFATGKLYRYDGVPQDLANDFRAASAKGMFFTHRIKGKYPVTISAGSAGHEGAERKRIAQLV
jgi:hypothetical protein